MSDQQVLALSIAIAAAFAASAVWARRTGGQRRLLVAWAIWTLLLAMASAWVWQSAPHTEGRPEVYVLLSIVPTLAATAFVSWAAAERAPLPAQLIGAGIICWVMMPAMALLGYYGL